MTVSALDQILRGTGLPKELWTPAQPMRSPRAAAPAISKSTQPLAKPPAPSPEPRNGQETGSTAIRGNKMEPREETDTAAKPPTSIKLARKSPAKREPRPAVTLSDFLGDNRPKVRLRGDNRLLSDVASELGSHLSKVLYVHAGEVVEYWEGSLHPIGAQRFRTLAERHVTFYRVRSVNESTVQVGTTLDEGDARGILASPQFLECLNPLRHLNTVRLPVIRPNGNVELLPSGYDAESQTLTFASVSYAEDMTFEDAQATISDLYSEFEFADGMRSRAVAVSALLGLFAKQLIPPGELRPAFTITKNCEGAGASTLASCCIVPVLGSLPTGVKAKDDDEMRKALTSAIRCGRDVLFLDNLKGQLNSPSLEAFTSAAIWTDRLLGSNEQVTGPNIVTTFITANGLSISPDWRRRSLFVELHLAEERAEDRVYRRVLSVRSLNELRPKILAGCWSLVRRWVELGRPQPSKSHSAFPVWAAIIGGVTEAGGFGCPLATSNVAVVADEDGRDMQILTGGMTPSISYTAAEVVNLCRRLNIFDGLVGATDADFGRPQRSAFGKLLARYDNRRVGNLRFHIAGSGHAKRFRVIRADDLEAHIPLERPQTAPPNESTPRKAQEAGAKANGGYAEEGAL